MSHSVNTLKVICKDGFELSANMFRPEAPKSAVMIAPATGIKKEFYSSLATYLAKQNYVVISFDNRGIASSKGANFDDGRPSLVKWGSLDMSAILDYLKQEFPGLNYHLVGHSAGGQLVGLMDNALDLKSIFNFGSSSGSLSYAKYPFKLKSSFYLNVFIPLSNFFFGHTKSQWVGMGEPLPKGVSSEWRRWCNGKGYVKVDLDKNIKDHFYDQMTIPSMWVYATDDDIANQDSVGDMIRVYSKMPARLIALEPREYEFASIGHMKFFSSKKRKLWKLLSDWLEEKSD